MDKKWFVYIVECSDSSYYTGISTDVEARVKTHNKKKGAKYTKPRTPVVLKYSQEYENRSEASKEECRIKKMNRFEKHHFLIEKMGEDMTYDNIVYYRYDNYWYYSLSLNNKISFAICAPHKKEILNKYYFRKEKLKRILK